MPTGDVSCMAMSRLFDRLADVPTPVADAYKAEVTGKTRGEWSRTEQTHMSDWFYLNNTRGEGQYTREVPNTSARTCYNRLLSHEGLLWIAEAVGVEPDAVRAAADAARSVRDYRSKCKAIRGKVPWDAVCARAVPMIEAAGIRI